MVNESNGINLRHLKRFARLEDLPPYLETWHQIHLSNAGQASSMPEPNDMLLLLGPTKTIKLSRLKESISKLLLDTCVGELATRTIVVPLFPPTSQEQAISWSLLYWPTTYMKTNPFGPHPSIISRAESEITNDLDIWMAMAIRVAARSKLEGIGEAIGAVIVDRNGTTPHAVALAGDSRWRGHRRNGIGNVMAHALLRAIDMVAQKRRQCGLQKEARHEGLSNVNNAGGIFLSYPQLPEEQVVFEAGGVSHSGYLCHQLEVYLTHEPCVMCSMALIHSRFGKVIFGQRMLRTGGLGSEGLSHDTTSSSTGSGHGLFWRQELNWCLLAWEMECNLPLDTNPIIHI
jgi:tRNA-specific adenosine deaminase 3